MAMVHDQHICCYDHITLKIDRILGGDGAPRADATVVFDGDSHFVRTVHAKMEPSMLPDLNAMPQANTRR
jgi:hypothetical protein